jgi:NAD(P)-dependent dehydrogenase (short-subunit alcohol dehydrogenase family)
MARLDGKVAIVTGGAQGIGATYAKALAREGAAVCVADIDNSESTVAEIKSAGGQALGIIVDVASADSVGKMMQAAISTFKSVDILVNNAALFGKLPLKPFERISSEEWDRVMVVNIRGVFECCKAAMPQMRAQGYGKIINIASGTVYKGTPMLLHYVTSKGAMVAFTRALAREVGGSGVRVNCIAPGLTMSENVKDNSSWAETLVQKINDTRAIQRDQEPDDLVGTLLYLCSSDSDFVTGQTIVVDGGSVMH